MTAAAARNRPLDAIIIGAGHNGLVAACYLARAGLRVCVLEARGVLGGSCVTEEVFPGFKVSVCAYVNSLFRPEIVRDLKLRQYGYEVLERNPSSFTPTPDGRHLMLGPDELSNRRQIAKFSSRDAAAYPEYEQMLLRVAALVEPLLMQTPPNLVRRTWSDVWQLVRLGRHVLAHERHLSEAVDVLTGSAGRILDHWFESDVLKATLATDAIIGAFAAPSCPGTAYVLFHHVMGEVGGKRGVWAYMRGGMGALSNAIAAAARDLGVQIRSNARVTRILTRGGAVTGVGLESGESFDAPVVASCADANVTFCKLLAERELPQEFLRLVRKINYDSASLKINLALAELPSFSALPGTEPGPQHRGTIHIAPTPGYIERAYHDAGQGRPSAEPVLECTIPSVVDETVAPPRKHLMSMFVQYAPYKLAEGNWDDIRDAFADRCIDKLAEFAPNIRSAIIDRQVISPLDLERDFSLTGGNIFQGTMDLNQLFFLRPVLGWAKYRTPIKGLYLCGSAAHPGGGVIGAAGANAAREILKDRARSIV